ncbi:MAG: S1C family serine protease [Polyangiaceae bacterium]
MEPRTVHSSAILICALALPLVAQAAPGEASAKPSPATPGKAVTAPPATKPAAPPAVAAPSTSPVPPPPGAVPTPPAGAPSPGAVAPLPPGMGKPSAKLPGAKNPVDAAVQQVVMLERAGRPIGVGTLLSGDGRILTALSPLTHGNLIDAHYPEGQIVRVKLSHSSRAWDLALLTPVGDSRHAGLKASREPTPTAGTKLYAVGYVKDKQLGPTSITIRAKGTLRGGDSAELVDALELPFAPKPNDIGGPLLNEQGEVVAIVARACSATDKVGCTLAPYAAPVSAVRDFLRGVSMRRAAFVGLDVAAYDAGVAHGVRVVGVNPDGPAANAGLRAGPPGVGDVVLAVDGAPVATPAAFADAVDSHKTGTGIPLRLMVLSEGRYREVLLMLREGDGAPGGDATPVPTDRVFQSNPSRPWPHPRPLTPVNPPNPYR